MPATEVGDHQNGDDAETSFIQESHKSNLDVSLNFHDYTCEPVPAPSAIRMIETQTCIPTMTIGTQTESVQTIRSISTQTGTCEQRAFLCERYLMGSRQSGITEEAERMVVMKCKTGS
ncbi:hypothetical protein MAR_026008, partial [Mya arenaria]